jgi:hypothetical protein
MKSEDWNMRQRANNAYLQATINEILRHFEDVSLARGYTLFKQYKHIGKNIIKQMILLKNTKEEIMDEIDRNVDKLHGIYYNLRFLFKYQD